MNPSLWSPLKLSTFRYLWLATLVSNIGTWMHEVGAGWLISTLTTSPVLVSLLQTATTLPAFFILLPSGALSDILNRRLYLLSANVGMALVAISLGFLTLSGLVTEWSLLILTFLMGIGIAMIMPAWQAIIPEVVPRSDLRGAIALNTLGMNISRVLGSLIAGVIIALAGSGAVFLLNALSFIFIIWVLLNWKRQALHTELPPEAFTAAIKTGLRYARYSPALQATIIRGIGFYFFASVMWALLPLIARVLLEGGSTTYSLLFASISTGAISSALLLPRIRARFNNDQLLTGASLLFATAISIIATIHIMAIAMLALAVCGAAWITVMTCAQLSAQTALPDWVRSRGMAVFLTFFMGSLAVGPVVWGSLAEFTDLPTAMLFASACLACAAIFTRRWPISGNETLDHTPSRHWQSPNPQTPVLAQQGPVMVCVHYQVKAADIPRFLELMKSLETIRRRDGAYGWEILEDTARPRRFMECFLIDSWLTHLRQHERITNQDRHIQDEILNLLEQGEKPQVERFVKPSIEKK